MEEIRTRLEAVYRKMRRWLIPEFEGPQDIYESILKTLLDPKDTWLDIGCGHQILPEWRAEAERDLMAGCQTIVGIDYDHLSLQKHRSIARRVRGDITRLPFKPASFDLVTANMVVEHLDDPGVQFDEISRVLKPGGLFIFHTPNAHGYFSILRRAVPRNLIKWPVAVLDGRRAEDVFPVWYRANTSGQIEDLARRARLDVRETRMVVSDAVFQVILPLAFVEVLWMKALMTESLKPFRTNIIATLRKPLRA